MSTAGTVGTGFSVDNHEVMAMARAFDGGPKVVQREMMKAARLATQDTRTITRKGMPYASGKMQANAPTRILQSASTITGEVRFDARSPKGFPYPWVSNYGHGVIRPKNKKWLRFRSADGAIVFTKEVRAVAGKFWAEKGLASSLGAINKAFDSATDRIVRYFGNAR